MKNLSDKAKQHKAKYDSNYIKNNVKTYLISFNKKYNADLIRYLDSLPNKTEYIKNLILDDMKKIKPMP